VPNLVTTDCEPILGRIAEARPDILLVAFGNPKQEKFIHMHRHRLRVPVCVGVGGTFDFIAGKTKRAPRAVQRLGLEFLHRWSQNPKRLGSRYKQNLAQFPPLILRQVRTVHRSGDGAPMEVSVDLRADCHVVAIRGIIAGRGLTALTEAVEAAFNAGKHVIVDLTGVRGTDGYALGALQNLWKRAAWARCEIRLVGAPNRLVRALEATDSLGLFRMFAGTEEAAAASPMVHFDTCMSGDVSGMTVAVCGSASVEYLDKMELALSEAARCPSAVCLDLRDVEYADCAALSALRRFADNRTRTGLLTTSALSEAVSQALHREKLETLT
jgi:N-acetylglucosaminyldiphosphoundecaprenol N-acetyl-beta-D-mannosaminyltransferase